MSELLRDQPHLPQFKAFVERILAEKIHETEFIVLFGSMAKGNWSHASDYDVFIGLSVEDGKRFIDRIYEYSLFSEGYVEPFVYTRSEIEQMFSELHPLLLEALKDGVVVYDRGMWRKLRIELDRLVSRGIVQPTTSGWKIDRSSTCGSRDVMSGSLL